MTAGDQGQSNASYKHPGRHQVLEATNQDDHTVDGPTHFKIHEHKPQHQQQQHQRPQQQLDYHQTRPMSHQLNPAPSQTNELLQKDSGQHPHTYQEQTPSDTERPPQHQQPKDPARRDRR